MRNKILALEESVLQLDLKEKRRKDFNDKVINYLNKFIDELNTKNGFDSDFKTSEAVFDLAFNEHGYPIDKILHLFEKAVNNTGIQPASGAHIGYIPGGGIPTAAYGDFIAAMTNKYSGIYYANPGAINIENHILNWFAQLFGFNIDQFGGNLTTGGSIANLISIVAARDKHNIKGKDYERTVIYGSEQMHHCIHKAIRISGLSECIYREIPLEKNFHLNTNALKNQLNKDLENGLQPFLIIASAGTTDTGVIDDLQTISNLADQFNCWFHVDAAYGGFFYLLEAYKSKFKGIEKADSLVIDPHKGMFLPYGSGAVLIKDRKDLLKTNYYLANYMKDAYSGHEHLSPADLSPELSRNFRGLRLWIPMLFHGIAPFKDALNEKLLLTQYLYNKFKPLSYIELGPPAELTVFTFRFKSDHQNTETLNREILAKMHEDGRIFISSTTINKQMWLRVAILSFRTHLREIDLLFDMIEKHFKNQITTSSA